MMRVVVAGALACSAPFLALACTGQSAARGLDEPLQVQGGQFIAGPLPGTAPPSEVDAGPAPATGGLAVRAVNLASQLVVPGGDKVISGRASGAPASIGVRFVDIGTGYWIVPIEEPDPNFPGQLTFLFHADFNANDPPGTHPLRFTAFDAHGKPGQQLDAPLCVLSRVPDNLHECDPTAAVPAAVITLQWDADFDLDLHVVTPDRVDINPKMPIGAPVEAGARPPPTAPRIDRDSLLGCVPDGLRQEDLVFQKRPTGIFDIYADPFDPCGKAGVHFKVTVYESVGGGLQPKFTTSGELLGSQATGGGSAGLFVYSYGF